MAQEQQGRPDDLRQDPLIDALVPDPGAGPTSAVVLQGFLGRGTKEGGWRLYLSASLDEYVELQEADILYTRKLPDDQGTLVWVPKSLRLQYVRVQSEQVEAEFLSGPIAEANLAGAAASPIGTGPIAGQPITAASLCVLCPISIWRPCNFTIPIWRCPSILVVRCRSFFRPWCPPTFYRPWLCPRSLFQPWLCTIQNWRCPTSPLICQIASYNFRCPSIGACPSFVDACPSQAFGCGNPGDPIDDPAWGGQVGLGGMGGGAGFGGIAGMDPMGGMGAMASMDPGVGPPGFAG
jgi:hypothetical protein